MSQRSHLTELEVWRVDSRLEGAAKATEVSQSMIFRIWKRCLKTVNAGQRPEQGRRLVSTFNKDRDLALGDTKI
ncbi:hypothetical protein TNCV_2414891 [Trichonephila clavipes]|nr:hypothetical protein TNCV_2414891 [Trichonephila clavipes]